MEYLAIQRGTLFSKGDHLKGFTPPSLEELANLYGRDINIWEIALDFTESLAKETVKLPAGEVELPLLDAPLELC